MPNTDVLNVMNALHITGKSPLLMRALNAAIQAAPYDVTVLVTGENGTGKDYFYKILHNGSRRRFKKCIAVNCGGLPEGNTMEEIRILAASFSVIPFYCNPEGAMHSFRVICMIRGNLRITYKPAGQNDLIHQD